MFKPIFVLYISSIVVGTYAKTAPFIDPCKWDDKKCLIASAQKAVPYFADGVPELGLSPLDPLYIDEANVNEGGLNILIKNMKIQRLKECLIIDVERNIQEHWLNVVLECPIDIQGDYTASGKLFFLDVQGEGPFHVTSEKVYISLKKDLEVINNHWNVGKYEHTFEFKEKANLLFENIFNGDKEKADPILNMLDSQWKEITEGIGKPIVTQVIDKVIVEVDKMTSKVPANELELQ